MNEAETRAELIDPALKEAGWGGVDNSRIRREVIAPGRLMGSGKRSASEIADYVLVYKNTKLGVIEAKRRDLPDTEGVGQAKRYSAKLHVRFAYSTNGVGIYEIDMETGKEQYVAKFPTPMELWNRTFATQNECRNRFSEVPFEDRGGTWDPRYYQHNAIEKTLEAMGEGKKRILLTLATGTGKTAIAFQLAWKLFHSRWSASGGWARRPRILFLADRNILADQAYNSFSAFAEDALVRISPDEIRKKGKVPKNGSIFFTIFQTFMTGEDEDGNPTPKFGEYPPDFFDFIIIDECHRGGANDESSWRGILNYFSPATQLGLTATPKRKGNVDTYDYFGEPVYVYSLKEGINDGYLTPFKVKQIVTNLDEYQYTPDDEIIEGEVDDGKVYTEPDFNRTIEIKAREQFRVQLFMDEVNQNEKSIVFCATQVHALAVRDLINQMKTSSNPGYCVRVTANDGKRGETDLKQFQDNEKTIPTVLTTSQKLSTGVDARNVRNIVLMRPVNSMIEFKQIVGRGTRLYEDKDYFTIYDFVKAHHHFSDPEWDGEPVDKTVLKPDNPSVPEDVSLPGSIKDPPEDYDPGNTKKTEKLKIKLGDGKVRQLQHMVTTSFWSGDGKPVSASEFLNQMFGELPSFFKNEQELREIWSSPDTRKKLIEQLSDSGYGAEQLDEIRKLISAEKSDLYDVLSYIAFAANPLTREKRANGAKVAILATYGDKQKVFLDFVLSQYVNQGVEELDQEKLPTLLELKYNAISDATTHLGSVSDIRDLFVGFQHYLYDSDGAA